MTDKEYMQFALNEARAAFDANEVPVGAVLVHGNEIVSFAHNATEVCSDPTAHAEIIAISEASKRIGKYALSNCTLYVTMEPCPMCAGAIRNAKIKRVVFGTADANMGAMGSVLNLNRYPLGAKPPETLGRIMEAECTELLQRFFQAKRRDFE